MTIENLQPIPEHLDKQEVRWVEVRNSFSAWEKRILLVKLSNTEYFCVDKSCEDTFLDGEVKSLRAAVWKYMREIEQPKKKTKIPYTVSTFPAWAVWIRRVGQEGGMSVLSFGTKCVTVSGGSRIYFEDIENWEIASTIPNNDGNRDWKPFYENK